MTTALIVLGIVVYLVGIGIGMAIIERIYPDAGAEPLAMFWPVLTPVALGMWLARPRPKRDPDAELHELDEKFAEELGIRTTNPRGEP